MGGKLRRWGAPLATGALAALLLTTVTTPANAAAPGFWADWGPLTGSSQDYTTGITIAGAPVIQASAVSDSRAGGVGVISGASTWLSEGTPVGEKYGSSKNRPYLNLRPKVDSATGSSTTTYTFAKPTPTSNWTFVLGDIDADKVQIRAIGPDNVELTADQLGYRGGFNYCAPEVAGKPSCTGDAADVPAWDAGTRTLTGNAAAADTSGSAAWFEPTAPISSLSFVFTQRSGFPVYQTWFASLTRTVSGTVTDVCGDGSGVQVTLTDANGEVVATDTTGPGGTYTFPGIQASAGYTVTARPADGQIVSGPASKPVDLSATDAVADFTVLSSTASISGVTLSDGKPLPGVALQVVGPNGTTNLTSDDSGSYSLEELSPGTYTITATAPKGYRVDGSATRTVTVTTGCEISVDQDFAFEPTPTTNPPTTNPPTTEPPTTEPPTTEPPRTKTPPGAKPTTGVPLANTGMVADTLPMPGVASGILVLGAAALLVARKRRSN